MMKRIFLWMYRYLLIIGILLGINMGLWELINDHDILMGIAGIFAVPMGIITSLWI